MIADTSEMTCITQDNESPGPTDAANTFWQQAVKLEVDADFAITNPSFIGSNGRYVYFTDIGTNSIRVYDLNGRIRGLLYPGEQELFLGVQPGDSAQHQLITQFYNKGIARLIYLAPYMPEGSEEVTFTLSAPEITGDSASSKYFNLPFLMTKDLRNKIARYDSLNMRDNNIVISATHSRFFKPFSDALYGFPIQKGWPAVGIDLDTENLRSNPFYPGFYDTVPLLRVFTRSGNESQFDIGRISQPYIKHQLGYFYVNPAYTFNEDHFYLVDKTSGELQVFRMQDILDRKNVFVTVQLFPKKISQLATSDPSGWTDKMAYMRSFQKGLFDCYIKDILATEQYLYVLVMDNSHSEYVLRKYNRDATSLLDERHYSVNNIPAAKYAILRKDHQKVELIGLEKDHGDYYLKTLITDL